MVSMPTPGLQYNPDNTTKPSPKISVGRQTSLSFMLGFNYSDWTSGWMSAFDGYTVFYSEPADKTLDPVYSIALSSDSVPIVSVKQTMTKLLGEPYNSNCIDAEKHKYRLKYFAKYTKRHCHAECSYEIIAKKCGCRAAFFPRKMDEKYEVCGFYDQAFCISAEIISFDFDICTDPTQGFNCLPECVSTRHQTDGFQNGIYRPTPITSGTNDIHMSTMVLYMTEVEEVMFEETPEYTLENYLSDVGGAAGLILGMSAATIVGFIEHVLLHLTWRSYQWFGKKSKWFAEKSKVFIHARQHQLEQEKKTIVVNELPVKSHERCI